MKPPSLKIFNLVSPSYASRVRYFLLVSLQSFFLIAFSQKQQIHFEHIGTSQGLSQSNVISTFQDSRGFMWFGTRDGLNKYDGYKFIIYKYDASDTNSISHNTIQDIAEDSDGNLWLATWGGGLNMFDRKKEKFVHYTVNVQGVNSRGSKLINCVLFGSDGNLWIGTEGLGLQVYNKKTNNFISYVHNENDPKSLNDDFVKDIVEDSQHNLWIGTNSGGLNLFDRKTKNFVHFIHDEKNSKSISANSVWNLFVDHQDRLWLGTRSAGLNLFDKEKKEFLHYTHNPVDINSINSNVIRATNEDEEGNIWVGVENGGLSILNTKTGMFNNYLRDDVDNSGINDNSIWSICRDAKGNMWVGTFSSGINFANQDANKFSHYRHNSSPFSLNNNSVLSILEDSKKNLWIGTDGGGINLFDSRNGTFTHYMHDAAKKNSIAGNYVLKIFEDSEGNLWIGTWGDGVTVFNKEKNTFKHFKSDPANPKGIGGNNVWTIGEDADKNIWLGFYNSTIGLDMYDRKTNSFIHYKNDPSNPASLTTNTVNTIFCDSEKNLWIGTNGGGVDLFSAKTNSFTHIEEIKSGISNNDIYCITEDHDGNLWIGTSLGLNRMDKKTGRITSYYIKDGLPSNTIIGILVDEKRNLWISTYNGLSRFDPTSKVFKNFGVNDGLQSNEFKMNSCYKSRSGKMYFGGINGFNGFFPDKIKEKSYDPPLVLTDFQIFNKQVTISNGSNDKSPLKKNITDTKELVLSHKQSVVSFEFASLNYATQDKKQYSYMLEGFDKDWNNIGIRHSATYTNLDPGTYIFKVRGLNNEGTWSSHFSLIKLTITPPFWLTWWFKILAIVTIIGGAILFYKFRVRLIKAQQIKLQRKVHEQTQQLLQSTKEEQRARYQAEHISKELERKNKELEQFAYVASHDMQEPLRTTSSFVELLQQQYQGKLDEKADKYLTFIAQSSDRMKVLIKDLLDYSRIGRKKELKSVDCNLILKEVIADIEVAIKESDAAIKIGNLPVVEGYSTELKQLFQNLIINALKFKSRGIKPEIEINADKINRCWEFTCKDNGIGIDPQHKERIFMIFQRLHTRSEYEGSGIGLAHCKKIVELHGGKIWVESTPGNGSVFYFTIPASGAPSLSSKTRRVAIQQNNIEYTGIKSAE